MGWQIIQVMKAPQYILIATLIAAAYSLLLLHFDQFIFFAPYFVFYVETAYLGSFLLDIALAILTGTVLAVSIGQIKVGRGAGRNKSVRTGIIGALVAILAGACPCYYLVPLLAVAGGLGGALGAVGILLNAYQVPVKVASLIMLLVVAYGLEVSMRKTCVFPIVDVKTEVTKQTTV
jgi:hypothetical protein